MVLIEGTWEDFQGTNEHIRGLEALGDILMKEKTKKEDKEPAS